MSFAAAPVYRLPPRPALRDWPLAGASAGLLLGLAELAFAAPSVLPPPLALLVLLGPAAALALAAALLGGLLHARGARPSYSALVAWNAGLIPLAAALPLALPLAAPSRLPAFAALGLAVAVLAGASYAAARLADHSERAGVPASAPWLWSVTAALVAGAERASIGATLPGVATLALLGGFALAGAGGACAAFVFARRRAANRPRTSLASLLRRLVAVAFAASFAPVAIPWLLVDRDLPPLEGIPAHILILALDPPGSATRGAGALADWSGIRYAPLVPEPARAIEALLTLPDGSALVPLLAERGYATAVILASEDLSGTIAAREIDARPGGRVRLEREFRWLAAAPWFVGPGRAVLTRLGWAGDARTPAQLASDARAWLLRRSAAAGPFFLLVDFRRGTAAGASQRADEEAAAVALLDHLDQADLSMRTVVLLVRAGAGSEPPLQVVVRPPLAWERGATAPLVARPVHASEIGAALREIARADGLSPISFPGIVGGGRSRPALALAE